MAGQLLLRCRSSSSSSPGFRLGFIIPNLPTFYRAFSVPSAASTRTSNLHNDCSSKLAEAESSEHLEEFKLWMLSDKEMLYRFRIFTDRLKDIEKCKKELAEAKSSKEWKVFESWMSKHKKKYRSDELMLYRFKIFSDRLRIIEKLNKKHGGGLNYFSDLTREECPEGVNFSSRSELFEAAEMTHWGAFYSWMDKHRKNYRSKEEMFHRFEIFMECLKNVEKANKENPGCTFGFNRFSDLTSEELPTGKSSFSKLPKEEEKLLK